MHRSGEDGTADTAAGRPSLSGAFGLSRNAASGVLGAARQTRGAWPALTAYERFEQVVSLVLSLLVSALIVAALVHLTFRIALLVLYDLTDPAEQEVFQAVFGMVMTLLIALEFNHSILGVLERRHGIVQVRTVVLIALLALVRKFIVIDAAHAAPATILGLAASVLALGGVYWLVRDQDRRDAAAATDDEEGAPGLGGSAP
jgi:uncharacterized membrane protein (DUF373 family)